MLDKVKLYYFDARYRAEVPRLLLAYGHIPYEDVRISEADFRSNWKSKMPIGQIPVLECKQGTLSQSDTIARFLGKHCGIDAKTPWQQAQADMLLEVACDLITDVYPQVIALITKDKAAQKKEWDKFAEERLPFFLNLFTRYLTSNKSGFLVGDSLTYADIAVAEALSQLQDYYNENALNGHQDLEQFIQKIFATPGINEYVTNRPKTLC